MNKETLTRKQLYDLVWSQHLPLVAKMYKISESKLRTICIEMSVPLPRAGYWEKMQAGEAVTVAPLSLAYKGKSEITLNVPRNTEKGDTKRLTIVPERLTAPDKLILVAKERLTAQGRGNHDELTYCHRGELDIRVAPGNIARALLFMDTLIKALRSKGYIIKIDERNTYVVIDEDKMKIALREILAKMPSTSQYSSMRLQPTGILCFKLDSYPLKEWKDGRHPIEEKLPEILAKLEEEGLRLQERERQWKKDREEQAEVKRIEKEFRQRQEEEVADFKELLQNASRWRQATLLRQYLSLVEGKAIANQAVTMELQDWLTRSREKVDWYDPLVGKEVELLKEVDKETLTFKHKASYW